MQDEHLHTDYERELVPLFFKVLGNLRFSRSKLNEDAVDRVAVLTHELVPQSPEKRSLLRVERFAFRWLVVEMIPTRHPDAAIATTDSFNRIGTHERGNVIADCPLADIELTGQIVVCIMPSQAKNFQQSLAAIYRAHVFTPFPLLLMADDKRKSGKSPATSAKFLLKNLHLCWQFIISTSENLKMG